jgi:hypothetical protein
MKEVHRGSVRQEDAVREQKACTTLHEIVRVLPRHLPAFSRAHEMRPAILNAQARGQGLKTHERWPFAL